MTQAFLMKAGQARTKGQSAEEIEQRFRGELADVLCHVLLLARNHEVDLAEAVQEKWMVWKPGGGAPDSCLPASSAMSGLPDVRICRCQAL
ncbi:hypothetical protein QLQ12_46015 [Actinoplanes sp. NEAU-A12]|uniref:Phosphoribosyl-ATP diphosphatase n=1 Tax=Actinoplanes sandaracinus TaxID=3045177 RepID=A0ABT6X282_9ACTN|nr:hypothetical protein [Actinoplanes sandaracinus]MDI6105951.1 hypothetical protein [Actinoplanes sandaracinus]